jgi:N-acetylglutamate synthase-like GNAT family acetyltransferase
MNIRQATKYDIDSIVEMLKHYREVSPLTQLREADDREYVNRLLGTILSGLGAIFVADRGKLVGMLISIKSNNLWHPRMMELHELAYWVEPEFRHTTAGYRLIKAYCDYGNELKQQGLIGSYTISKMINSPDLKYDRFGFSKLEEKWVN